MPIKRALTPDELNQLEAEGYNTSKYKGELIEFPDPPDVTSKKEALGRGILANFLPATAGAAGFAAGANPALPWNAAAIAAAPETMGASLLVPLIGGVAGSALGSGITSKVQETLTPDSVLARNAIAAQEHPWITKGAQLTATAATMAPNPMMVVRAGAGLGRMAIPGAAGRSLANNAEREALKQVSAGAGIGAGSEIGRQALSGDGFHAGGILEAAGEGALFNSPTVLGHKIMGSKPSPTLKVDNADALMDTIARVKPNPEQIEAMKLANEAKKNELKATKEVLKAKKLQDDEAKQKAKIEEGIKKAKEEPIKLPEKKEATATAPKAAPVAPAPQAAPAPAPIVIVAPPPVATQPIVVAPKAPVTAKPKAAPKTKATPAPAAPKVERPAITVTEPTGPTPEQKIQLDAKGILPQLYEGASQEKIVKWLTPTPVVARPSVAAEAPAVPQPKTKAPKVSKDEFYAGKRKEYAAPIERITEAWHDAMDSGDNKPLEEVIGEYGGKGADILQIGGLKPESNEFVDAVMKLRGDKSKPGKSATKKVVAEKPVEPAEPKEITPEEEYGGVELNQKNENIQTPLGKEVADALAAKKKSTEPTTAYKAAIEEINAGKRGLTTTENPNLPSKGKINVKTGQIEVNSSKDKGETLDTRPHEGSHDLVRTIYEAKAKGSKRAADYIDKLEQAQKEGLDAYNKERAGKSLEPVEHEEFAVSQQGHEFLKQQLNLLKETKWKKWWNDTKALYNTAFKKNPSMEELRRVLNFRYVNENVTGRTFPKSAAPIEKKEAPVEKVVPFKDAAEKDVAIRGIKTPEEAKAIIERLKVERDALAKEGMDSTLDSDKRHNVANRMMANKLDIQSIAEKHGVESGEIKYQGTDEGLPLIRFEKTDLAKLKTDVPKEVDDNYWKSLDTAAGLVSTARKADNQASWKVDRNDIQFYLSSKSGLNYLQKTLGDDFLSVYDSARKFHEATDLNSKLSSLGHQLRRPHNFVRNQDSNEGLPKTDYESDILPPDPTKQSFFRRMSATFDRVAEISPKHAQAARDYENRKSGYMGMANTALVDLNKYSHAELNKVMAEHRNAYRNDTEPVLDGPNDQAISKILSDYYGKIADIRNELGIRINNRQGGKNKYYVPDMMNAQTIDTFINNPMSPEATMLKREWAEHVIEQEGENGRPLEEIMYDIDRYIEALGGAKNNYKSLEFGAIRKAAGYGLPESMRDPDAMNTLSRYSRRAASDIAFFQEIQSKPDIAVPLHIKDQNGELPDAYKESSMPQDQRIKDMMKWITNDIGGVQHNSPLLRSLTRLVNNALLGPATGIRDLVSVPMNALPYVHRFSDLGAAWKSMMSMRENSRAALESGARQPQIDKLAFDDVLQSPNRFAELVGRAADGLRKYQGREFIENLSRDITFSMGKELGRNNIIGARAGNARSKAWLKKFGDLVDGDILKMEGADLEKALNQIGKNFTDRNQGTYGGRGLPVGMVESQFAPFFALQKWSVEKANVIYKDVYKPFMTGENRLPMLTYTLGSLMTGAAIQQLNTLMAGKKGIDPTIKEALDKGDAAAVIQELGTLMQLGSYAGIMSDGIKTAVDTGIRGRVPRNVVSFPTATATIRTAESLADMAEALRQNEDPWKVLKAFTIDLMSNNIQAMRMLANRTINDEVADRKDKFRDVHVFNELEGKPAGVIAKTNPYLGLDAKEFKQTKDVKEAAGMAGGLVRKAAAKSGGSVEEFRKSLSSLKGNSYQTMPSPETSPEEFKKFYGFLVRTYGADVANERVKDYVMQKHINTMKNSLIP